jgi:leucyl-tRNA---protein transferase
VDVSLVVLPEHECAYLPERQTRLRAFMTHRMAPAVYDAFMDAGFRRSGKMVYQPICRGCRACQPIRVLVDRFHPSKSQRRVVRRNLDLAVTIAEPEPTDEKLQLYRRYMRDWHGGDHLSRESFERFLYESPVATAECCYRDAVGRLLAVGICDLSPRVLSSVYFYFDPAEANRGLGNFGALWELQWAQRLGVRYYYLGYYVAGCTSMQYKSGFGPCEILCGDGQWREMDNGHRRD